MNAFREKIFIGSMCVVMFIFGAMSSCIQTVKDSVFPVEKDKPVIVDPVPDVKPEPKPTPAPEPKPEPEPEPAPQPKPEPKAIGKIVMYTSGGCIWCIRWEQNELQKVKDAGWEVVEVESTSGTVPRFDVTANGKTIKHTGYMSMSALRGIVERLK